MSKMSTYFLDLPEEEQNESGLHDDPAYIAWCEQQDKEDIKNQDNEIPARPF